MEHIVSALADPTLRQIVGPAVGNGLKWAVSLATARFAGAPEPIRKQAEENTEKFADVLAGKIAERVQQNIAARQAIGAELGTPKGAAALQRSFDVATEIDDDFTRANLAELVARRLTVRGATRLQLATRIATDAMATLSESHLRLLAFMLFVQGQRPAVFSASESDWTNAVTNWMRKNGPAVVITPDFRDLGLLASAGLVNVMPDILGFDLKGALKSPEGFTPQIDTFLSSDVLGMRIKAGFDIVMRHRLNLAGMILAATVSDKLTGSSTDLSEL